MSYIEDNNYDVEFGGTPVIDFEKGYWTDKQGKRWKLSEMETRHINNCVRVLERTKEEYDYDDWELRDINAKIKEFKKELNRRSRFPGNAPF